MRELSLTANAKLNLSLDVLNRRPDGYHDVRMILQSVDLHDDVSVTVDSGEWSCRCDDAGIPRDEKNLAMRAVRAFLAATGCNADGISVFIRKRIPSQAGLGGGSADAAAVLRALNTLFGNPFSTDSLIQIGASIGSDVPFCLLGGTALAEGRGERLTCLPPMPACAYLLLKPSFSASTPELYQLFDKMNPVKRPDTEGMIGCLSDGDLDGVSKRLCNVFQPVLNQFHPVEPLCGRLLDAGALGSALTGSGSVVFGVFRDEGAAKKAAASFRDGDLRVFLAKNAP